MIKPVSNLNLKSVRAAGMTEYILIVFLIALLAYVAVQQYGKTVSGRFIGAGNKVEAAWGD